MKTRQIKPDPAAGGPRTVLILNAAFADVLQGARDDLRHAE